MDLIALEKIDGEEPITKTLSKIKKKGLPVLVYEGKKLLGIVEEKDLSNKKIPQNTKTKTLAKKVTTITENSSIFEICKKFFSGKNKILLVENKNKIVGALDRWALLKLLLEEGLLKNKKVQEVMVSPVLAVEENAKISFANSLMKQKKLRRLAVIKNSKLVGVISIFDIAHTSIMDKQRKPFLNTQKSDIRNLQVKDFMKKEIFTIGEEKSLEEAAKEMINYKSTNLIVVNKANNPIGIITIKDMIKNFAKQSQPVEIILSHLNEKEYKDLIYQNVQNFAQKFNKIFHIQAIELRFKEEGKQKEIQGKIIGEQEIVVHSVGFNIQEALKNLLEEFKQLLIKQKEKQKILAKKLGEKNE
ncbi:MAG: CBS domain-containing protein [Candidatus Anstonellaceae archaeon]